MSFYRSPWILSSFGLIFAAIVTNAYLDTRFPSSKTGILARFNPGRRDFKNAIVKLYVALVVMSFITFAIGFFRVSPMQP